MDQEKIGKFIAVKTVEEHFYIQIIKHMKNTETYTMEY